MTLDSGLLFLATLYTQKCYVGHLGALWGGWRFTPSLLLCNSLGNVQSVQTGVLADVSVIPVQLYFRKPTAASNTYR